MFSGDYDEFNKQRQKYTEGRQLNLDTTRSREIVKSYLDPAQTEAWVNCMRADNEIIVTYNNIDKLSATVTVAWEPREAGAGPLKKVKVTPYEGSFSGSTKPTIIAELFGKQTYVISRPTINGTIRATVNGTTKGGYFSSSHSADIYVPAVIENLNKPPKKYTVSLKNEVLSTNAYWAGAQHPQPNQLKDPPVTQITEDILNNKYYPARSAHWICPKMTPTSGLDLVIATVDLRYLGKRRGLCTGPGSYCDSTGENCVDEIVRVGCFVNTDWHLWYKRKLKEENLPYAPAAVCAPE